MLTTILMLVQFFFSVVIGIYFWKQLKLQKQTTKPTARRESNREMERLRKLRGISLTVPLSEKARPSRLEDIIGQEEGVKALHAILCGPNPQHVLIYGPPGIGKTCAARLVLEQAKLSEGTPFRPEALFVEMDATTTRFDERSIADPLIGSVHDPIYQGAGPLGIAGVPQPKPGAVTKAHGGVLFLDEIGELHPTQMNKLLKVLEDRRVFLESAYYDPDDAQTPQHIHDIFQNGLPADFRLIGATTRSQRDIPAAIRSRCMEVFFRPLLPEELATIAMESAEKVGYTLGADCAECVGRYADNGREAVNIVQMAAGLAYTEGRMNIEQVDIDWVIQSGRYTPHLEKKIGGKPLVGVVNGLAVMGEAGGAVLEIETVASRAPSSRVGHVTVTGIAEEEELDGQGHRLRRRSTARCSVDNVMTVLAAHGLPVAHYDIHVNMPGGMPVDGPSAGMAIAVSIYSAVTGHEVDPLLAMTGELSVRGEARPVGGVPAKIDAAKRAGAQRVLIPRDNWQDSFESLGVEVVAIDTLDEALAYAMIAKEPGEVDGEDVEGVEDIEDAVAPLVG